MKISEIKGGVMIWRAVLIVLLAIGASVSVKAQTALDSYEGFVWTGGSGTFSDFANFDVWLQPTDYQAYGGTGGPGYLLADLGLDVTDNWGDYTFGGDVLFSSRTSPVSIGFTANAGGPSAAGTFNWMVGNGYSFNLNGFHLGGASLNYNLMLGVDSQTVNASFNNGTIDLQDLTVGAYGSSGNRVGTSDATVTFTGVTVNAAPSGNVTVGSAGGGTNNVLRIGADSPFNNTTFALATVASGSTTAASNNKLDIDGGNFTVSGLTVQGSGVTGVNANNQAVVENEGVLQVNGQIAVQAGSSLSVLTGGNLSTTGFGSLVADTGSTVTVDGQSGDGVASALSVYNIQVAGNMTISNGGTVTGTKTDTVNANGGVTGNLTITGSGSSYSDNSPAVLADGSTPVNFSLGAGGNISVLDGGSFLTGSSFQVTGTTGTATIDVDPDSSFTIGGNYASQGAQLSLQGGGTVWVDGSFVVNGLSSSSTVTTDVGTDTLNANGLVWKANNTGADSYSGIHGRINVANSIAVTGNTASHATIGAGTQIMLTGNTALSGGVIYVSAGGTFGGVGHVTSGDGQGGLFLNGGTLIVGTPGESTPGTLSFNGVLSSLTNTSTTFAFTLFSGQLSDTLALGTGDAAGAFRDGDLLDLTLFGATSGFHLGDTFQLFTNLSGGALGTGATFSLDAQTLSLLASDGFSADLSNLATNGTVTLDAVAAPEPSTWAFLFLGLGALAWRVRRSRAGA